MLQSASTSSKLWTARVYNGYRLLPPDSEMGCKAKIAKLIPAALGLDWKLDCWISFGATFT